MIVILKHNFEKKWSEEKLSKKMDSLPKVIYDDILKISNKEKQLSTLVGKLLLMEGLKIYNTSNSINNIEFDKNRKPFIKKAPHFNISHSNSQVVCAISPEFPIGIDVEKIKNINIDNFIKILSDEEINFLKNHPNPNDAFFDIWTQKEAIMKADGRGIIPIFMKNLSIENNVAKISKNKTWYLKKLPIHPEYKSHIATPIANPEIRIINSALNSIIKEKK